MKDPVEGTAKVAAVDFPHGRTPNDGRPYTRLDCVVSGPGIEPASRDLSRTDQRRADRQKAEKLASEMRDRQG